MFNTPRAPATVSDHYRHFGELIATSAPVPISELKATGKGGAKCQEETRLLQKALRMNSRRLRKHLPSNVRKLLMRHNYCRDREVHVDGGEAQGLL